MTEYLKLSELDEVTTINDNDLLDTSVYDSGDYTSKKITFANVKASVLTDVSTISTIGISIDNFTQDITTGIKGYVTIPFNATIKAWYLTASQTGSIVIDIWKDTYANYPPTVADTITGSEKPTLSSSNKNNDTNLTTWTTSITSGDILAFNVDSCSGIKQATLVIEIEK